MSGKAPSRIVAVVGNPNCGKTTLFNAVTGSTQQVGNWPGVTVEKKVGTYTHAGETWTLVDLPGVYLLGNVGGGSHDERVARDYVLSGEADVVVDVIDAGNLERNLYLTVQLIETGVRLVVVLNMVDMAKAEGIEIDVAGLSDLLGCPIVPMVASRRIGMDDLKAAIAEVAATKPRPRAALTRVPAVETAIAALAPRLAPAAEALGVSPRWAALKLVEGDDFAERLAGPAILADQPAIRRAVEAETGEETDVIVADARFRFVGTVMTACHRNTRRLSGKLTQAIDRIVLDRALGVPVFLGMMYLMFLFTISIGGAFIDVFDLSFGAVFVDALGSGLAALGTPSWLVAVASGLGSGIQTVSTFVPIIACLFLFLSVLEDSGYMARAAFVMDRAMRAIGLPGKSFVPLIVGFGCNVPAIMATRTLESRRDRVLTVMMAPFMACGARLPVFALFAAAFFPTGGQNVVFGLYIAGLAYAVITGLVLKSTLLKGEATPFLVELPPYHIPTVRTVVFQAWHRLKDFIFKAGQVIVPMVMVLSVLSAMGTDGSFKDTDPRDSVLAAASRMVVPVLEPIGIHEDNWPAAVGLFTGIFAKEAVIGTLNALYAKAGGDDAGAAEEAEAVLPLGEALIAAAATVPENLKAVWDDLVGTAVEEPADSRTIDAMQARFDTAAAFAYMLLILLYTPCVATVGAMRQEIGLSWTIFAAAWTTGLGWLSATAVYQALTFFAHPAEAAVWLVVCAGVVGAVLALLWWSGRRMAPVGLAGGIGGGKP